MAYALNSSMTLFRPHMLSGFPLIWDGNIKLTSLFSKRKIATFQKEKLSLFFLFFGTLASQLLVTEQ